MPDLISVTAPEGQDDEEEEEEEDGFVKVRGDSVSSCGSLELQRISSNEDDVIR